MDKNEYNLKLEEIDKYVNQGNYSEAAKVADTIDWRRVRNVRTLCMISEIYEADDRYEDSKNLLLRAYRRSPVGRAILYRLVEVTIQLKQFDEAIEYYSEYVQAAPHDNNKYILKYKIYRGRGSSLEEQIDILKEYLSQEYNEKWAYELARLYQQADMIQECLATCDDLVLWFHSGKYVIKALELKRRYAALTPKQQEIYDHRFDAPELEPEEEASDETTLGQEKQIVETKEDELAETIMEDAEKDIAQAIAETQKEAPEEKEPERTQAEDAEADGEEQPLDDPIEDAQEFDNQLNKYNTQDLQTELVKSMREIVYGVGNRMDEDEKVEDQVIEKSKEEQEAASAARDTGISLQMPRMKMPDRGQTRTAGQLSIDDILLSMGEKGNAMREAAARVAAGTKAPANGVVSAMDEALMGMGVKLPAAETAAGKEMVEENDTVRKPNTENREAEEISETEEMKPANGEYRAVDDSVPEDIATAKTRRIPTDEIAEIYASYGLDEDGGRTSSAGQDNGAVPGDDRSVEDVRRAQTSAVRTAEQDNSLRRPEQEIQDVSRQQDQRRPDPVSQPVRNTQSTEPQGMQDISGRPNIYGSRPMVKEYQRGMFAGFLGIQNLEEQIASAITLAGQKGEDRTSRTGNILIFGGHGCGKTTIATGIAKAIAQDKGNQFVKMAKIYASDFNRKDIAATIAKIAGGTLIIEEAGDLEDAVVDQLTTAMEFRTDGLIIILEDEQKYIHDLLMRHPRFTMKFTSQIFIPVFTIDELVRFGQIYAGDMDYVFSDGASAALYDRIGNVSAQGDAVSITNVIELVDRAITKSNKFFRKLTAGKKRYDENNCIILQEKDFK